MASDTQNLPATQAARPAHVVQHVQPLFDTARFEHFQRAAKALMHSTLLPDSVRGDSPEQCFSNLILVGEMADRFKMPMTALAQCISIVHGKMMIEGKAISAALTSTMSTELHYHYTGERGTDAYRVYVSDKSFDDLTDEQLAALAPDRYPRGYRMIDGSVGEWKTFVKNSTTQAKPNWTGGATRNQLAYRGAREWARLYEPGVILGVYSEDEIDAYDARVVHVQTVDATGATISAGFAPLTAQPTVDAGVDTTAEPETVDAAVEPESTEGPASQGEAAPAEPADDAQQAKPKRTRNRARDDSPGEVGSEEITAEEIDSRPMRGDTPAPDEIYWLEGDAWDDKGKRQTYKNGEPFSRAGPKARLPMFPRSIHDQPDDALEAVREAEPELTDQAERDHAGMTEEGERPIESDADFTDDDFPGDSEAEDPLAAFGAYQAGIRSLNDWGAIKQALSALTKTDAWKVATESDEGRAEIRKARVSAWCRNVELMQAGNAGALRDFINDLTAFRCWMETTEDADALLGSWQTLIRQPVYTSLRDDQKGPFERLVAARMEELRR